jgi:hypothetical protein
MLRELTKSDWLAILALSAEQVPQALILRGTRNLKHHYHAYRAWFDDVTEIGPPNGIFEDVFIGRSRALGIGYASVYGASMASEIVHLFGVLGTRLVIQTGCCGHEGKIYTTAALLAEGNREIEAWHNAGSAAVDMETATTFAVADYFGMDRASILFGFDNPRHKSHILLTDAEKDERRARGDQTMIQLTFSTIHDFFSR